MSQSIAGLIDHALLHPTLTDEELKAGCELCRSLHVAAVCIKPYAVPLAKQLLEGSGVAVCTVIGFPHGSNLPEVKALEADLACQQGATELDMVVNVGRVLSQDWKYVERDIRTVVEVAGRHGAITKVIFETEFVADDALKIELCRVCDVAGADFVKTSTGFGYLRQPSGDFATVGATEHDIKLMRKHRGNRMQVKASGGIRDYATAARMRSLGATRIGTSSSANIIAGEREEMVTAAPTDGY